MNLTGSTAITDANGTIAAHNSSDAQDADVTVKSAISSKAGGTLQLEADHDVNIESLSAGSGS